MHNIPNIISVLRIVLVFPIAIQLLNGSWTTAFVLIFIAGVSDALDGFLARTFNWQSELGAMLDPIADKLLLLVLFFALAYQNIIPNWLAYLVISRDIVILTGAISYRWITGYLKMAPLMSSKINTALQIVFVLALMYHLAISELPEAILVYLKYSVVATTIISGINYVVCWSGHCANYLAHNKAE